MFEPAYLYIITKNNAVMKKYSLFLIAFFLISTGSVQKLTAQEKTKSKDKDMEQSIDMQKKAMSDQAKAEQNQREMQIEYSNKKIEDELEDADSEKTKIFMNLPRGNRRSWSFNEQPFVFAGSDMEGFHWGETERTNWDFSKTLKENTFSRDYSFDVEKTAKSVVMSVMGDCKAGDIKIKIIMPNGKSYSDILIDESGNLNWRKSFTLTGTENQDKTGDWKFQISSNKATGFFKISLQTY